MFSVVEFLLEAKIADAFAELEGHKKALIKDSSIDIYIDASGEQQSLHMDLWKEVLKLEGQLEQLKAGRG